MPECLFAVFTVFPQYPLIFEIICSRVSSFLSHTNESKKMPTGQPSNAALKSMSIEKLQSLREQVDAALSSRVTEERRAVQDQLGKLNRIVGTGLRVKGRGGVRGAVAPKYVNPDNPAETWAGRGLKPRWLTAALKAGGKLQDFSVDATQRKPRGRRKKAKA